MTLDVVEPSASFSHTSDRATGSDAGATGTNIMRTCVHGLAQGGGGGWSGGVQRFGKLIIITVVPLARH